MRQIGLDRGPNDRVDEPQRAAFLQDPAAACRSLPQPSGLARPWPNRSIWMCCWRSSTARAASETLFRDIGARRGDLNDAAELLLRMLNDVLTGQAPDTVVAMKLVTTSPSC
jgi:hypothetical protein